MQGPPRPVRLLAGAASARTRLDFRTDPHLDHLGDGWLSWAPAGADAPGGWLVGPSALAALAAGDGDLVLRGIAPPQASYPIEATLAIVGGGRQRFLIERPGRFGLRFPRGASGAGPPTAEGQLAVIVASRTPERDGPTGPWLRIDSLGFEPAASTGAGPRRAATE
jgi:hypothetical protein